MAAPQDISALWFDDGRPLGSPKSARAGDFAYLNQIALACDAHLGDAWRVAELLFPKLPLKHGVGVRR